MPTSNIPRFIVGLPRAGTTWMSRSLNLHPDIASFGETAYWGRLYVIPNSDGFYEKAQLDKVLENLCTKPLSVTIGSEGTGWMRNITLEGVPKIVREAIGSLQPPVTPGATFISIANAFAHAEGCSQWVEKTPHQINWIDRILDEIPESRFVVMLRNPYDFMLSYKHQDKVGDSDRRQKFTRRYHPLGAALVWRGSTLRALNQALRLPQQFLLVKLEDLHDNPQGVMQKVGDFFELDPNDTLTGIKGRENSSFDKSERPELPGPEIFWMNFIGGRLIEKSGYQRRFTSGDFSGIIWSFFSLPSWGFRVISELPSRVEGSIIRYIWRWLRPR